MMAMNSLHSSRKSPEMSNKKKITTSDSRRRNNYGDCDIIKGAEIIRRQLETSLCSSAEAVELTRNKGSNCSPNSVAIDDITDEHIIQIYEDLNTSELAWETSMTEKMKLRTNKSPKGKFRGRNKVGFEVEPPLQSWKNTNTSSSNEISSVDISGEGMEVTDQDYFSSKFFLPTATRRSDKVQTKCAVSAVQPLHGNYEYTGKTGQKWASDHMSDDDILELQNSQFDFPGQENWDNDCSDIQTLQNNVYVLKPGDYNNDNSPVSPSLRRTVSNSQYDSDIYTVEDASRSSPMKSSKRLFCSKSTPETVNEKQQSAPNESKASAGRRSRSGCTKSLFGGDSSEVAVADVESPQKQAQASPRTPSKCQSEKDFRSIRNSNKSFGASSRSADYFSNKLPSIHDVDTGSVPSPLSYGYIMLREDPAYLHAQQAGFLWQSIVGQHVRFPSSWWNGARSPPMGVSNVETCKWSYFGRQTVRKDKVLNQLVASRGAPGRLLLHVIVQDDNTRQSIKDVAIGCFHPNARGVRETTRATRGEENSRDLWLAVRKRAPTTTTFTRSEFDRLISNHSSWGESGYSKSPLGPGMRVNNDNMRSVFGETPPLETLFLAESELYERLTQRVIRKQISLPLAVLQEFVYADS